MTITDLPPSAFLLDEWYRVHGDQADEEGWSIFEAEYEVWSEPWPDAPAGYVPHVSHIRTELQLQRVDDAGVFLNRRGGVALGVGAPRFAGDCPPGRAGTAGPVVAGRVLEDSVARARLADLASRMHDVYGRTSREESQ